METFAAREFTTRDAESMLPRLNLTFAFIQEIRQNAEDLLQKISKGNPEHLAEVLSGERACSPQDAQDVIQLRTRLSDLASAVDRLATMGVMVHDLELGLVDFMTEFEGKKVCLCWQLGEPNIHFYHEIGDPERHMLPNAHPYFN
jgi:hypothetical protein